MVLPLTQTETLALAQAVQRTHARYRRLRAEREMGAPDYLVLTAANQRQAAAYRLEIQERARRRFFPPQMRLLVVPDPEGQRIGSGGATLNALRAVAQDIWRNERDLLLDGASQVEDLFLGRRILVMHSGGDSRRLPHYAASGKIFAELPIEAADGRAATLFDELFVFLVCALQRLKQGMLVASGDVLLVFDTQQVKPATAPVTGFAIAAPVEQATHHGVYVADRTRNVRAFLHKLSEDELRASGAADALGRAWIDTGLVVFSNDGLTALADIAGIRLSRRGLSMRRSLLPPHSSYSLDLYDDVLPALSPHLNLETYRAHAPERQSIREHVWKRLRGLGFQVLRLAPAQFIHLGTTVEYQEAIAEGGPVHRLFQWRSVMRAQVAPNVRTHGAVITTSHLGQAQGEVGAGAIIQGTHVVGALRVSEGSILSGLKASTTTLHVRPGVVLHQVPVRFPADYPVPELRGTLAYATSLYGVRDNPKGLLVEGHCTLFGQPARCWLAARGIQEEAIWGSVPPSERCLWNARLFPVTRESADLAPALWLQEDRPPTPEERTRWEAAVRLSLAEMAVLADCEELLASRQRLLEELEQTELQQAVAAEVAASEIVAQCDLLGGAQTTRAALERLATESPPLVRARVHILHARLLEALAEATPSLSTNLLLQRRADAYEELAFAALREAMQAEAPDVAPQHLVLSPGEEVVVALPVRIDFGGGWSDTPPHSLERGGAVLNAAVLLEGQRPVRATVRALPQPEIRLQATDLGSHTVVTRRDELFSYQDPSDPFALHKAAIVLAGLAPPKGGPLRACLKEAGGGIEVVTESRVPKGSGLGTSSILGACLISALRRATGRCDPPDVLFEEVLRLEQMLTTGGGWQDQVGGLVPGIKLVFSRPGIPQRLTVEPLTLSSHVLEALHQRLVLVYVGHRRLAKNILRMVMGRYMARDPEVLFILGRIQEIARAMRECLLAGDLDGFGALMREHWELNQRLDPNSTNRHVEAVLGAAAPYASGFKMVGAGGGGFAEIVARDPDAAQHIGKAVAEVGGQAYSWTLAC